MVENAIEGNATEVVEVQEQVITSDALTGLLETLDKVEKSENMLQLNGEYFDFAKVGDSSKGVFVGYQKVKFKDLKTESGYTEEMDAVKWLVNEDGTKKIKMSAGAALVNEFKKNGIKQGTGILIKYRELGGKNNQTKLFDVAVIATL